MKVWVIPQQEVRAAHKSQSDKFKEAAREIGADKDQCCEKRLRRAGKNKLAVE